MLLASLNVARGTSTLDCRSHYRYQELLASLQRTLGSGPTDLAQHVITEYQIRHRAVTGDDELIAVITQYIERRNAQQLHRFNSATRSDAISS